MSNIQGIINNLMEIINSPPLFDNNIQFNNAPSIKKYLNKSGENLILGKEPNIIINNINNKDNKLNVALEQKIIDVLKILIFGEFIIKN